MNERATPDPAENPLLKMMPDEPDFSRLPVVIPVDTSLFGVMLIMAGAIFPVVLFLLLSLMGWVMAEKPPGWFWIKTVFSAIPLLALPWGWWVKNSSTKVEIGAETVRWQRKTPLGRRGWSEPRSSFHGLSFRKVLPRSNSGTDRFPHWVVYLEHPNEDRKTALTHTQDQAKAREVLDGLARLTGMAVLADEGV